MQYGTIPGIDKPVSRLVQGTLMINPQDVETGYKLMDSIVELGCTAFDTARVYQRGENEGIVGKWIHDRGLRDKLVIIAKGAHHDQSRQRVTPEDITADIHTSLSSFQFDYIDIYLLHRDDPSVPVGPIIESLNEHSKAGRIRIFGASNWSTSRIQEANVYAEAHGLQGFTVTSPNFSLAEQFKEPWPNCVSISGPQNAEAQQWYLEQSMPVLAWSSLAGGFFSGRFERNNLDSFTDYFDTVCVNSYCYEPNFQRLDRVRQLAAETGLSVAQIAMAYVMNQPMDMYALVGCQTPAEYQANIEALETKLSPETLAWLDLRSETH
ncbi:MAG: aldo/keto reductase [Anaerolineae bacterium]